MGGRPADSRATTPSALAVGVALLALGAGAVLAVRGSLASRLVLACSLMGMTAPHIQLGRCTLEFHFGVFATLALLLVYRAGNVRQSAEAAATAHQLASSAVGAARRGGEVVQQVVANMDEISASRRPAPASRAAASRWWPARCARWRSAAPRRRARSRR